MSVARSIDFPSIPVQIISARPSGRGKLPAWVVRIRFSLVLIRCIRTASQPTPAAPRPAHVSTAALYGVKQEWTRQ
jgi:hypothetical protein